MNPMYKKVMVLLEIPGDPFIQLDTSGFSDFYKVLKIFAEIFYLDKFSNLFLFKHLNLFVLDFL